MPSVQLSVHQGRVGGTDEAHKQNMFSLSLERELERTSGRKGRVLSSPFAAIPRSSRTSRYFAKRPSNLRGRSRQTNTNLFGQQKHVASPWKSHN